MKKENFLSRNEIRVFDRYPQLIIEFSGAPDDAEFATYLAKVEAAADKGAKERRAPARTAVLLDSTEATRVATASQRRMQAEHMVRMKEKAKGNDSWQALVGVCFVLPNAILRGALTAVLWLQPMSECYEVCATRKEADEWCRKWLQKPVLLPAKAAGA